MTDDNCSINTTLTHLVAVKPSLPSRVFPQLRFHSTTKLFAKTIKDFAPDFVPERLDAPDESAAALCCADFNGDASSWPKLLPFTKWVVNTRYLRHFGSVLMLAFNNSPSLLSLISSKAAGGLAISSSCQRTGIPFARCI